MISGLGTNRQEASAISTPIGALSTQNVSGNYVRGNLLCRCICWRGRLMNVLVPVTISPGLFTLLSHFQTKFIQYTANNAIYTWQYEENFRNEEEEECKKNGIC